MGSKNKVAWSEGMFLQPQHFQQHDRFIERLIRGSTRELCLFDWGFFECKIDEDQLGLGKVALSECRGIFPDGTPFNLPFEDTLPPPLDIPTGSQDSLVYLAIPLLRQDEAEIDSDEFVDQLARFHLSEYEVKDNNSGADSRQIIQVARLQTRLVTQAQDRSSFAYLGVAKITECRSDKKVILDNNYIPAMLNCSASVKLQGFVEEILGLIKSRADGLANQVTDSGQGGVAEIADFMLLQMVNRYEYLLRHYTLLDGLHPELFYRVAVQLMGELATFIEAGKRCRIACEYVHDDLQGSFLPVMNTLREYLSKVLETTAIAIPLSGPKYGVYAGKIPDINLLDDAVFILAVKADISPDVIRSHFSPKTKIGPVEKIQQLVRSALPGVTIHAMPVAPRQIPYHSGFSYYELNKANELWGQLKSSGGIAIHIGGEFPNLQLELWAIRNG